MTIESAAGYLRENLPDGFHWDIDILHSSQWLGPKYKVVVSHAEFGNNIFSSRESLWNAVVLAMDWADSVKIKEGTSHG